MILKAAPELSGAALYISKIWNEPIIAVVAPPFARGKVCRLGGFLCRS